MEPINIKIAGINENSSKPSERPGLIKFVLDVTQPIPMDWSDIFEQAAKYPITANSRQFYVENEHIVIECKVAEMQDLGRIENLKAAVKKTNDQWNEDRPASSNIKNTPPNEQESMKNLAKTIKF